MGVRGPKSIASRSTVVTGFAARLPAPEHLTAEQAAEWTAIIDSLPGDYFRPGDVPLLAAFCTASALYKEATARVREDGMVITLDNGRMAAHPAVSVMQQMGGTLAQMAVKLRLCPSARYTEQKAATKAGASAARARPWEQASGE